MRIKPKALLPGAHIRVVTPASAVSQEDLDRGLAVLAGLGYKTSLAEHALAADGYIAGDDESRAADLQAAFADPGVDAVFCSRGGYGCARLLRLLDLDAIAKSGKPFVGFSDVTTLHLALNRRGLVTYHAPMLLTLSREREPWVVESLAALLKGGNPIVTSAPRAETLVQGVAEGVLTGGCLCLLTDSIATPDALETDGKILLIEDVDEHPHRVDAMLTHLLNCGLLQRAAGIVIGEMTRTDEKPEPSMGAWPWRKIIEERIAPLGIPAVVGFPFGHMPNMLSLPLGVSARLDADVGALELLEGHTA